MPAFRFGCGENVDSPTFAAAFSAAEGVLATILPNPHITGNAALAIFKGETRGTAEYAALVDFLRKMPPVEKHLCLPGTPATLRKALRADAGCRALTVRNTNAAVVVVWVPAGRTIESMTPLVPLHLAEPSGGSMLIEFDQPRPN